LVLLLFRSEETCTAVRRASILGSSSSVFFFLSALPTTKAFESNK
jgi:hypothetical protein